jgi:zinc transport system substrate-binding protein
MKKILIIASFLISSLFASNQELTVTILPQKYFVEKIVKDKFTINVMVPPGSSPHNFEPKPSAMKALFNSKLYFLIDDPSEKAWIEKFKQNAKNTIFVDSTTGITKIAMKEHKHEEEPKVNKKDKHAHHDHKIEDKKDEHNHDGFDPHVWLDPILVKIQAKNIYEAVVKVDEANSDFYKVNYEAFIKELDELDSKIATILAPHKGKAFMVFHPSWGYFAQRYNLEQIAIEIQGKEPKPNELIELIGEAKKHDIKVLFVSNQFSQTSAKTISKNLNANVVTLDPLSQDFTNEILKTANEIARSYQ